MLIETNLLQNFCMTIIDTHTDGKPLLDGVDVSAWEPILICQNNFVNIIQICLDLREDNTSN